MRTATLLPWLGSVASLALCVAVGCSDDAASETDASGPDAVVADGRADSTVADAIADDAVVGDAATDIALDGTLPTFDHTSKVTVGSFVQCGSAAASDCKGDLYWGIADKPAAAGVTPYHSAVVNSAAAGTAISAKGIPIKAAQLYLIAFLDDNGDASVTMPAPASGDLVFSSEPFTPDGPGTNVKLDIALDFRLP